MSNNTETIRSILIALKVFFRRTEHFWTIAIPGAFGGYAVWLLDLHPDFPVFKDSHEGVFLSIIFGAMAGFILIVVLTNAERSDPLRLMSLAFISGLIWPLVINKSMILFGGDSAEMRLGPKGDVIVGLAENVTADSQQIGSGGDRNFVREDWTASILTSLVFDMISLFPDRIKPDPISELNFTQISDDTGSIDLNFEEEGIFELYTDNPDKDLIAGLYLLDDDGVGRLISYDDDSGRGLNPRIQQSFDASVHYVLKIFDLDEEDFVKDLEVLFERLDAD